MMPVTAQRMTRGTEKPGLDTALSTAGHSRQNAMGSDMNTAMRASNFRPMYRAWGICAVSVMSGRRKYRSASLAAKKSAVLTSMKAAMSISGCHAAKERRRKLIGPP